MKSRSLLSRKREAQEATDRLTNLSPKPQDQGIAPVGSVFWVVGDEGRGRVAVHANDDINA